MGGVEKLSFVVDTHALCWWIEEPARLSARAEKMLTAAECGAVPAVVCAVSFWELELKKLRGSLETRRPLDEWVRRLSDLEWLSIAPVDANIWLASARVAWTHRDPADRIIAATAMDRGLPVLTKDTRFHEPDCPVEAVW